MYLNKQASEYASDPKYAIILNKQKFRIWQGFQYASNRQQTYASKCLDFEYILGSICQYSEYGRDLNMQELHRVLNTL